MSAVSSLTSDLSGARGGPDRSDLSSSLITHHSSLALYVHVPFCVRKCFYCDFNSGPSSAEAREAYVETLCREIRQSPWARSPARTVFFGGGTPSELTTLQLARINEELRAAFRFEPEAE